ncbi:hypothetical protein CLF_100064 [Clonorchis sinensis]|uniref:Uncharacterized protein n=1 Tax=Clonorchis sinensis TaxID=79923 RepID=G7Y2K5_CLOSI|nr:hypothetical protein CLF_100064 [Clonorchis sinensis]
MPWGKYLRTVNTEMQNWSSRLTWILDQVPVKRGTIPMMFTYRPFDDHQGCAGSSRAEWSSRGSSDRFISRMDSDAHKRNALQPVFRARQMISDIVAIMWLTLGSWYLCGGCKKPNTLGQPKLDDLRNRISGLRSRILSDRRVIMRPKYDARHEHTNEHNQNLVVDFGSMSNIFSSVNDVCNIHLDRLVMEKPNDNCRVTKTILCSTFRFFMKHLLDMTLDVEETGPDRHAVESKLTSVAPLAEGSNAGLKKPSSGTGPCGVKACAGLSTMCHIINRCQAQPKFSDSMASHLRYLSGQQPPQQPGYCDG